MVMTIRRGIYIQRVNVALHIKCVGTQKEVKSRPKILISVNVKASDHFMHSSHTRQA